MYRSIQLVLCAVATMSLALPAHAMPLAAKERIDQLTRWIPFSSACERLGYKFKDGPLGEEASSGMDAAIIADAVALGADPSEAKAEYGAALDRNIALFTAEIDALKAAIRGTSSFRPVVTKFYASLEAECVKLAADPIYKPHFVIPTESQRIATRIAAEDALLEGNGEASWQGPKSQALGDLFSTVGACRRHLSETDLAAFRERLAALPERSRAANERRYTEGIDSSAQLNLDPQQCERAIASFEAKAR